MEWLRKISAAIDYIETNLDKDLSFTILFSAYFFVYFWDYAI